MGGNTVTLDVDRINREYTQAVERHLKTYQNKEMEGAEALKLSTAGGQMKAIPGFEVPKTLCEAWPKVEGFLRLALRAAAWFPGTAGIAAAARAVLTVMSSSIVPLLCKEGGNDTGGGTI